MCVRWRGFFEWSCALALLLVAAYGSCLHGSIRCFSDRADFEAENVHWEILRQDPNSPGLASVQRFDAVERYSSSSFSISATHVTGIAWQSLVCMLWPAACPRPDLPSDVNRELYWAIVFPFSSETNFKIFDQTWRLVVGLPEGTVSLHAAEDSVAAHRPRKFPSGLLFRLTLCSLMFCVVCAALVSRLACVVCRWTRPAARYSQWNRIFGLPDGVLIPAVFCFGFFVIYFFQARLYHRMPGFGDEMNYLMQARIFRGGHVSVPAPQRARFFAVDWMDMFGGDKRIWDFHPPGNAIIHAIGWAVGCYWLMVPVLGGLNAVVQFLLARELFVSVPLSLLYVLVLHGSHYYFALASSFMAHLPAMLFLALALLGVLRFQRKGKVRFLLCSFLALAFGFLVRPLSAVLFIVPLALWLVPHLPRTKVVKALFCAIPAIALGSLLFWYAFYVSGQFTNPYLVKGPEVGQTLMVRLNKGLDFVAQNLYRNVNEMQQRAFSFGMVGNSILCFVPIFLAGAIAVPLRNWLYSTYLFYVVSISALHWYGWKWEPRMLYEVFFIPVVLSLDGAWALVRRVTSQRSLQILLSAVVVSLTAAFLLCIDLPWRLSSEYQDYQGSPYRALAIIEDARNNSPAIVLFGSDYALAPFTPFNTPTFDGPILFANSFGANSDYELLFHYPGRKLFFSMDGNHVVRRPNFYYRDVRMLEETLAAENINKVLWVFPWAEFVPNSMGNSNVILSPKAFLRRLEELTCGASDLAVEAVILVGEAVSIEERLNNLVWGDTLRVPPTEVPVVVKRVQAMNFFSMIESSAQCRQVQAF